MRTKTMDKIDVEMSSKISLHPVPGILLISYLLTNSVSKASNLPLFPSEPLLGGQAGSASC